MFLLFLTYRNLKLMGALLKHFTEPTPLKVEETLSKVFGFYLWPMPPAFWGRGRAK